MYPRICIDQKNGVHIVTVNCPLVWRAHYNLALLCVARDYDRLRGGLFYFGLSGGVFVVVWRFCVLVEYGERDSMKRMSFVWLNIRFWTFGWIIRVVLSSTRWHWNSVLRGLQEKKLYSFYIFNFRHFLWNLFTTYYWNLFTTTL